MNKENIYSLPNDIPIPKDDGMCKHLEGMEINRNMIYVHDIDSYIDLR